MASHAPTAAESAEVGALKAELASLQHRMAAVERYLGTLGGQTTKFVPEVPRRPSTSAASGPAATPASAGAPTPKPMPLAQDTQCLLNFLLEGAECEPHKPSALVQQLVQRMQERVLGLPPLPTTAKHLDSCAQLFKKMLAQQVTITAPWDRCVEMMSEVVAAANAGDLDCQRGLIEIHDTVMSWMGSLSYQEAHQQGVQAAQAAQASQAATSASAYAQNNCVVSTSSAEQHLSSLSTPSSRQQLRLPLSTRSIVYACVLLYRHAVTAACRSLYYCALSTSNQTAANFSSSIVAVASNISSVGSTSVCDRKPYCVQLRSVEQTATSIAVSVSQVARAEYTTVAAIGCNKMKLHLLDMLACDPSLYMHALHTAAVLCDAAAASVWHVSLRNESHPSLIKHLQFAKYMCTIATVHNVPTKKHSLAL
eukprot:12542-Heterococcus_DN1.PRE.2